MLFIKYSNLCLPDKVLCKLLVLNLHDELLIENNIQDAEFEQQEVLVE